MAHVVHIFPLTQALDASAVDALVQRPSDGIGKVPERALTEQGTKASPIIVHPDLDFTLAAVRDGHVFGNGVTVTTLVLRDGRRRRVAIIVMPPAMTGPAQGKMKGALAP